ncbi:MAG: hypothetical protein JO136_07475, partial [Hyphomicrobiales bacterium]|nr:hypothetical protein [Hyphomicrobiales bacterium]
MTVVVPLSLSLSPRSSKRSLALLASLALTVSIALLFHRAAPGAPAIFPLSVAVLSGLAALALAFTLDDAAWPKFTSVVVSGAAIVGLCALLSPEARLSLASFASAAFGVGLGLWLIGAARTRPSLSLPLAALFAATVAGFAAYAAYLVLVSRDLMIADFMTYRGIAMTVAQLIDARDWPLLLGAAVRSITQDYSWAPALVPGLVLALTEPTSRAIYTFSILALYAAPAALALAMLARDCAPQAGLSPSLSGQPRSQRARNVLALGVAAVFVAYPAA